MGIYKRRMCPDKLAHRCHTFNTFLLKLCKLRSPCQCKHSFFYFPPDIWVRSIACFWPAGQSCFFLTPPGSGDLAVLCSCLLIVRLISWKILPSLPGHLLIPFPLSLRQNSANFQLEHKGDTYLHVSWLLASRLHPLKTARKRAIWPGCLVPSFFSSLSMSASSPVASGSRNPPAESLPPCVSGF